jgi:hypothetical protein
MSGFTDRLAAGVDQVTYNALKRRDLLSVEKLSAVTGYDLGDIPNLGNKRIQAIADVLAEFRESLAPSAWDFWHNSDWETEFIRSLKAGGMLPQAVHALAWAGVREPSDVAQVNVRQIFSYGQISHGTIENLVEVLGRRGLSIDMTGYDPEATIWSQGLTWRQIHGLTHDFEIREGWQRPAEDSE